MKTRISLGFQMKKSPKICMEEKNMILPFIYMTMGSSISIRFPEPAKSNVKIVLGEDIGEIPKEAYIEGSPAELALKWAETYRAKWSVYERENGGYNVTIKFDRATDAVNFKNNFMSVVHGA